MAGYRLTLKADADLDAIFEHSVVNFGLDIARSYLLDMQETFVILGDQTAMGRDIGHIKAGARRHEHASHVIYYRRDDEGVLILRVLHQAQDPLRHL